MQYSMQNIAKLFQVRVEARLIYCSFFIFYSKVCKDAPPKECPTPAVQSKGGLVCVSTSGKRFCKPMCNEVRIKSIIKMISSHTVLLTFTITTEQKKKTHKSTLLWINEGFFFSRLSH